MFHSLLNIVIYVTVYYHYLKTSKPLSGSRPLQAIAGVIVHHEGIHTICNQNQLKRVSLKSECEKIVKADRKSACLSYR